MKFSMVSNNLDTLSCDGESLKIVEWIFISKKVVTCFGSRSDLFQLMGMMGVLHKLRSFSLDLLAS